MKLLIVIALFAGAAFAQCGPNGKVWGTSATGDILCTGKPQASIFPAGGTKIQRQVECVSGTVPYASLTAAATNQDVTVLNSISESVYYDHIRVTESTPFALGALPGSLNVGTPTFIDAGYIFPLLQSGPGSHFTTWYPTVPGVTGTYNVVLNFATRAYYGTAGETGGGGDSTTLTATNGSASITGSGTTWTAAMTGLRILIDGTWYPFTRTSDTTGTLGSNFTGSTAAGKTYTIQAFVNSATAGLLTWEACGYAQ